jgi:hypothetical protein
MRSGATLLVTAVLGVGSMCVPRDAHALGPVDLEVAGKVGVGTNPFGGFPNPLGFGLGARAGVSILGLYGGLGLMYYFGSSQNLPSAGGSISSNALLYGLEGGYGAKLFNLVTLRGQLGLGSFTVNQSGAHGASGNSVIYLEPGLTALLTFGTLLVGADANVLILPGINDPLNGQSAWDAAFTIHAQGGVKF